MYLGILNPDVSKYGQCVEQLRDGGIRGKFRTLSVTPFFWENFCTFVKQTELRGHIIKPILVVSDKT